MQACSWLAVHACDGSISCFNIGSAYILGFIPMLLRFCSGLCCRLMVAAEAEWHSSPQGSDLCSLAALVAGGNRAPLSVGI